VTLVNLHQSRYHVIRVRAKDLAVFLSPLSAAHIARPPAIRNTAIMPGLVQSGRKRPSVVLSEDDDEKPGEQSDYPSSVSMGSKRARRARDASESPSRGNGRRRHNPSRRQNIPPGVGPVEDVFQPGTLVRVKLRNFVTYTAAEFHLGPSLNMIIGPNGTGKSTLVCAICLGLGWSSEHLGRAKELNLFVKNGADEAEIEIELAAGPGMATNPIVRRIIRKSDGKSIFWIDGKHSGKNAVLALCKQFSIQIDNLCQFLPQDRVVEFAKMTDVDRLRETQRAAAPQYMVEWHDQLKELRAEEKTLETKQQNEKGHLEKLERQQNADKDDVERYHQREGLLQKSRCLDRVRPIIELALRKNDLLQAKQDLQAARRELDQINADVEPVREAQADVKAYKDQIEQIVKLRKNRVDVTKTQADKLYLRIEKGKQDVADFVTEINKEASGKKEREKDIARSNAEIQRLERQRQNEPLDYDAESFERRKAEFGSQLRAANNRKVECEAANQNIFSRVPELQEEKKRVIHQRTLLETQSGKRANVLQRISRDTAEAWRWFENNRDQLSLKGEVYGPPILECSIRDPRFADAVETQLKKGDLVAITCTNADDQKMLSTLFLGRKGTELGLHDIYTRTSLKPLSHYRAPVAPEELPGMGFQGYLIDYIEGPDAVLAMLCDNSRLHRTAYAARPISEDQHATVSGSAIQKWVSGRDIYQITTRREYGASSTAVTQVRPAKHFVDQPVNSEEKRQLDDALTRIQQDSVEMKEESNKCKQEIIALKQQIEECRQGRDEVQAEQDQMKKAVAEWKALPGKIQQKQVQLDRLVKDNAETSNRIRVVKTKSQQALLALATFTLDYAVSFGAICYHHISTNHFQKTVTQLRAFHEALVEGEIRLIESNSEYNALEMENRDILQKQQRKQAEIQTLSDRNNTLRDEFKRLSNATQKSLDSLQPEEKAMVLEYRQLSSLEALELEVSAVAARLEMMVEGNSGVIRAFEKRKDDIARTKEKLEEHIASLEDTKVKITEIREQWEPELDALISKISDAFAHNFEQIGCAGEVEVYKDEEDFDKWSIQISVRFRQVTQASHSHMQTY
jgi:chromosome segregation ATPase